ncbi:glycosyltransferase family 4 protein [Chlamydiota bacterium]
MKILLDLRGPRRGGSWTYIRSLVPELVKQGAGHEITIVYDSSQIRFDLDKVKSITLPFKNKVQWILWSHWSLPKKLKNEQFDLYHSLKQLNAFKSKTKLVYTFHTAGPYVYPQFYKKLEGFHWRYMFQQSAKKADAIIVCSDYDKKVFVEKAGIPPEKVYVTYLAPDKRFKPSSRYEILSTIRDKYALPEKFVLFVGTLYPFKNVPALIDAFAVVQQEMKDLYLVIVGEKGWGYEKIFTRITELSLEKKVVFLGPIDEDLPGIYHMADIFVFPSCYESFGLPPLESLACGTPTIVSNKGALPEIVCDGAVVVDPDNTALFAQKITELLLDDILKQEIIVQGIERAIQFSWERCAKETLAIYEKILK